MIVCTECGHRNDDGDDFCGSCGAFLEFSGERSAPEEVEAEVEEDVDEEHRATIVERVKAAVGLGEAEAAAGTAGAGGGAAPTTGPASDSAGVGIAADGAAVETEEEVAAAEAAAEVRRRSEEEAARKAAEAEAAAQAARHTAAEAVQAAAEEAERAAEAEARRVAEQEAREAADRQAEEAAVAAARAEAERVAAEERASGEADAAAQEEADRAAQEAAEEEARQRAEAEAREGAERAAREEAEAAKRLAEEQAKAAESARLAAEEREREAEQAARMAALVAKAKPAVAPALPEPTPPKAEKVAPTDGTDGEAAAEETVARKPAAVKPQKQKVKRAKPTTTAADEVLNPGDLVCGQCGVGNDPGRKFCRRCGHSLVAAAVVPKLPWYKRIFRRKPKAKAEAGTRPDQKGPTQPGFTSRVKYMWLRLRSWARKSGKLLAILGIGGVALLSLGPWRGAVSDQLGKVKRLVSPEYEAVRPASAEASPGDSAHPAGAAIDQVKNSYWAEGVSGPGEGAVLTLTFAEPVDLDRVGFLNGASEQPDDFTTQPRIKDAQLSFNGGSTKTITLDDKAEFQEKSISADDVTTVQLQILSVYPSPQQGDDASLAEIEFFTKK